MLCTPWHHCVNANASSTLRRSLHTIHKRLHILLHERLQMQVMGPHRFNPDIPIPAEATAIHGITDADVATCPKFGDAAAVEYMHFMQDCDLHGFNARRFDVLLIRWAAAANTCSAAAELATASQQRSSSDAVRHF